MSLAAVIVLLIENPTGSFSLSQRCTERLAVGSSETWPFSAPLPFDPSRHELLPLHRYTKEGLELSLPLSDLSQQSLLIGAAAGSPLLSWIKRKRGNPRSPFPGSPSEYLRDSGSPRRAGKKEFSELMLEPSGFRQLIVVLIKRQRSSNISHCSLQQLQYPLTFAFSGNNISVTWKLWSPDKYDTPLAFFDNQLTRLSS